MDEIEGDQTGEVSRTTEERERELGLRVERERDSRIQIERQQLDV